ncbi:MAG: DUF4221 domain-containing protein [Tannerella sp.]|nr:DUF4221 domain-containing protein [Tannerella sp.]
MDIDIDSISLTYYPLNTSYKYNGDEYFLGYNFDTHAFDIFNLSTKTTSHIELVPEGPDGLLNVRGIYAHSVDSIWVFTDNIISLVDSAGKVKERIDLPLADEIPFIETNFTVCTSKIYYHFIRNSLFYLTFSVENNKNIFSVHEYSPTDRSVKKYPLKAIENHDFRNQYGWKQFPNVTFSEENIIYNFPIESNIYLIDIKSGETTSYGGKSLYTSNNVTTLNSPFNFTQGNRHLSENVHFYELLYDPHKKVYYRLHFDRIDFDTKTDFYALCSSKDMYLNVFNEKMEVINETKLDRYKYNYRNCWGILNKGFFIAKDNMLDEDKNYEQFQIDVFYLE